MADEVIRPVVFDIQGRLEESLRLAREVLERLMNHSDPFVQLRAVAEHRLHVALAARVMETAAKAEAIRDFHAAVLDALADAGVVIRRNVIGMFEVRLAA